MGWDGALHVAVCTHNLDRVRELLAQGYDINCRYLCDRAPLHLAAELAIVRFLMDQGSDVNVQTEKGLTPLHFALKSSSLRVCEFLLTHGADMAVQTVYGDTLLHWMISRSFDPGVRSLFDSMITDPRPLFSIRDRSGDTPLRSRQEIPRFLRVVAPG
jgi:ankyrin repeat protein